MCDKISMSNLHNKLNGKFLEYKYNNDPNYKGNLIEYNIAWNFNFNEIENCIFKDC
jgi:hypothetical protein